MVRIGMVIVGGAILLLIILTFNRGGIGVPSDWSALFSVDPPCDELDADTRAVDERCTPIHAWANGPDGCVDVGQSKQVVGCQQAGPCTAAISWAKSPAGQCMRFSSGCTPVGWTSCSGCVSDTGLKRR